MNLNIQVRWAKKLGVKSEDYRWRSDDNWIDVDIESLAEKDLDTLMDLMEKNKDIKGTLAVKQKIVAYRKLSQNPGGVKVTRLEHLATAVKKVLEPTAHKWIFSENADGYLVPWYVYNVVFHPHDERNERPAHTTVSMAAIKRGNKVSNDITFYASSLGDTAYALLREKGFFIETEAIVSDYASENARYQSICNLTGHQFLGTGAAHEHSGWGGRSTVSPVERDGMAAKMIMDDDSDEGEERSNDRVVVTSHFWTEDKKNTKDDGGEAREMSVTELPVQAYVKVFDLGAHTFKTIHVANLAEYVYDSAIIHKLILPPERKEIISMLVAGADMSMDDIVKGKTGGIIAICTGEPGTGKTLTAEAFSEQVKKPLYSVHCSQLGTNEEALEKELRIVLSRAMRWGAILLVDEADVYVHARGNDIHQNAIVGVFLRVLEYYRGILFMTSNRETIIDDAIISRATAVLRYDLPDRERAAAIWKVLSTQYNAGLTEADISVLVSMEKFRVVSGRSIKSLLKLAKLYSTSKKIEITVKTIDYVSQFLNLERVGASKESPRVTT